MTGALEGVVEAVSCLLSRRGCPEPVEGYASHKPAKISRESKGNAMKGEVILCCMGGSLLGGWLNAMIVADYIMVLCNDKDKPSIFKVQS